MYEIDFDKVAKEYNKKADKMIAPVRLKAIYKGTYPYVDAELQIKKILRDSTGNIKKKYLMVDYNELAKAVYEKHDKLYTGAYLKAIHSGNYKSGKVLGWINEILAK